MTITTKKKTLLFIFIFVIFISTIVFVIFKLNQEDKNYSPTDSDASEPTGFLMYTSNESDNPVFSVYRINKIAGTSYLWDSEDGISVKNNKYQRVAGTDLGAITKCGDKYYINFGDTIFDSINYSGTNPNGPWNPAEQNFLVAFSNSTNIENLTFNGYLAGGDKPNRALADCHNVSGADCYTIPNSMFSVLDSNGQCVGLFSQYMDVNTVGGHNHKSYASYIAKMDWNDSGLFKDYKGNDYKWSIAGAPNERYDFTMASFVQKGDYIYMFGSPAGRFGGLKVARIETSKFLNTTDLDGWEYFTNDNQWVRSKDLNFIKNSAKWVISPKDSNYTYFKNYADGQEAIQNMTIAEFSVVYNPYLGKYLLMTGRPDSTLGVYMYLADQPQGPWEEKILMPNKSRSPKSGTWTYYGTYTTSSLLKDNGKTMYFLATTWQPYGVYVYRVDFSDTAELPLSAPQNLKFECVNGKGVFTWDVVQGASKYMIRINREPESDWANVLEGDIADHNATTNRYEVELQSNKNYVWWSVQGIKSEEVYPYSGVQTRKTGQFSCNPIPGGCTPNCAGRQCGSDGCTGSCGTCEGGKTCNDVGQCVEAGGVCTPNCAGKCSGSDGCGGTCPNNCLDGSICVLNTKRCVTEGESDIDLNDDNSLSLSDYVSFVNDYRVYKRDSILNGRSNFNGDEEIGVSDYVIFVREYIRLKKL